MKAKKLWLPLACLTLTLFTQAAEQSSKESSDKWSVDVYDSRDNHAWGGVYMSREDVGKKKGHIVDYSTIPDLETDATLQKWQQFFGEGNKFNERDGKAIYQHSCAGCHMHEGEGAFGAGYYPPLANNPKMQSEDYIYSIMINGFRGMPYFRDMLDDEQMVEVVRYIQQELNDYTKELSAEDVKALRHDNPPAHDISEG